MVVRVHWWRDALHAARLAIPPLVAVLVIVGAFRFVSFMKVYGPAQSVSECLWLARSLGRFDSLAAPFLVAAVWVAAYPLLVGLRWALHSRERGRTHGPTVSSATHVKPKPPVTSPAATGTAQRARRKSPAA